MAILSAQPQAARTSARGAFTFAIALLALGHAERARELCQDLHEQGDPTQRKARLINLVHLHAALQGSDQPSIDPAQVAGLIAIFRGEQQ
ncbi:MAG: hypothetical protein ACOYEV_12190 [Candidatus Nanopelagicales bacterium]